jgi:hypothetical protein
VPSKPVPQPRANTQPQPSSANAPKPNAQPVAARAARRKEEPASPDDWSLDFKPERRGNWKGKDPGAATRTPEAKDVLTFINEVQGQLLACAKGRYEDPEGALRKAANVTEQIPDSCQPGTRLALQGLLDAVKKTVDRVFDESDRLVVTRSEEEIQAEQRAKDIESSRKLYEDKVMEHHDKGTNAKTTAGKEYERGRHRHYKGLLLGLPTKEDIEEDLKTAAQPRKTEINERIEALLGDLETQAQKAVATMGAEDTLPQGTDGGVTTMKAIVESYAEKLARDAE